MVLFVLHPQGRLKAARGGMQDADGVAGERCRPVEDLVDLPDQRLIRLVRRVVQGVGQSPAW